MASKACVAPRNGSLFSYCLYHCVHGSLLVTSGYLVYHANYIPYLPCIECTWFGKKKIITVIFGNLSIANLICDLLCKHITIEPQACDYFISSIQFIDVCAMKIYFRLQYKDNSTIDIAS